MDKSLIVMGLTAGLMGISDLAYTSPVDITSERTDKTISDIYINRPVMFFSENERISEKLNMLLSLEDNWDGYNGIAPLAKTVENVRMFISLLKDKHLKLLSTDDIVPSPYGTVSLYFEDSNDQEISVEFGEEFYGANGDLENEEIILEETSIENYSLIIAKINSLQPVE